MFKIKLNWIYFILSSFFIIFLYHPAPIAENISTLRVGHPTPAVSSADPFARDEGGGLRFAIYDALTWIDSDGQLKPALAKSWKNISPNIWRFELRQNVKFSNEKIFNSESVIKTLKELYNPNVYHPKIIEIGQLASFKSISDSVVEIETINPDPLLPKKLSLLPIIEPFAWDKLGHDSYKRTPVGTGPYLLSSWGNNNTNPILTVSKNSWRKVKSIKRVDIKVIPDPARRVSALLSGELDIGVSLPSDDVENLELNNFVVRTQPSPNILSIGFRTVRPDNSPLKNPNVRKALNYAVDKKSIVELILNNTTRVAHQPATPDLIGYNSGLDKFNYNPQKAKFLLNEAGYSEGFPLKFYVYGGLLPGDSLVFQKMAQDLSSISISTELRQITFPDYVRRLFSGDWGDSDGFSIGWMNHVLWDPQRSFEQFSCAYSAPFYCDEEIMPLINQAKVEMDPIAREKLLQNIVAELHEQGAALWLIEFSRIVAFKDSIRVGKFRLDGTMFERIQK